MNFNEQQLFWREKYSKEYIRKNSNYSLDKGIKCWAQMLKNASDITNILECGSNIGKNIGILNHVLPSAEKSIIEISPDAFQIVTSTYDLADSYNGTIVDSSFEKRFDLVFSMGVLIHIHPNDLLQNMNRIFEYSNRYILIGEYFSRTPEMIEYHGEADKLFKRDFGKMFLENFSVELVDYGFLWGHLYDEAGFDDITYWLFEKK